MVISLHCYIGALELLEQEIQPDAEILETSGPEYHKNLALSLFYKVMCVASDVR